MRVILRLDVSDATVIWRALWIPQLPSFGREAIEWAIGQLLVIQAVIFPIAPPDASPICFCRLVITPAQVAQYLSDGWTTVQPPPNA